jgi:Fe-S cluster assembly protein SufD
MFKSILDGKSRAVFDGIIKVVKDAQKTDAAQSSRNLLLSKRAIANANPRLEILADDVSCSHGSTTGFLDPDALFYLRSRGLGERQAKALLVYGFAHEQIEAIRLQALRDRLEKLLLERFTPTA